jgi:hypothetical protein
VLRGEYFQNSNAAKPQPNRLNRTALNLVETRFGFPNMLKPVLSLAGLVKN